MLTHAMSETKNVLIFDRRTHYYPVQMVNDYCNFQIALAVLSGTAILVLIAGFPLSCFDNPPFLEQEGGLQEI